jgi:protein-disulfide isomerase
VHGAACAALIAWTALAAPSAAAPLAIPWAKLEGAVDLLANERETVAQILRSARGYVGCTKTVAECLAAKPVVPAAWRLARYVVFLAGQGLDEKELGAVLAQRRASVLPEKAQAIPLLGAPLLGDAQAKVVIVEYADFRCGHCAVVGPLLKALQQRRPKQVALCFKPYALAPGPSVIAARAALAAHRQGKFWQLAELLFANPDQHTPDGVTELARRAKLDLAAFESAFGDRAILQQIDLLKIEGLRLGLKGTPTIFVNGKRYDMPKDARHLAERIDDELDLLDAAPR